MQEEKSREQIIEYYNNIIKESLKKKFIDKAKQVHDDKSSFDKVIYNEYDKNIIIVCPEHGDFLQTPHSHVSGSGCQKCGRINAVKLRKQRKKDYNIQDFINDAKDIHGKLYDYSLVNYKNKTEKVTIICPLHGEFQQSPSAHLHGSGCQKCNGLYEYNDEYQNKYTSLYNNEYEIIGIMNIRYVVFKCKTHGVVERNENEFENKLGCKQCNNN